MKRLFWGGLALLALPACARIDAHGPPRTDYRVAYFPQEPAPVHAAVRRTLERWNVRVRSDDGRVLITRPFKDGPSTWKMQVDVEHAGDTTAVLVKMEILKGGDVEADVVDTDYEALVRWQIGGDPDAFALPADPGHPDEVKAELVAWLKRWREGRALSAPLSEEERARNRRQLFLTCLRLQLAP